MVYNERAPASVSCPMLFISPLQKKGQGSRGAQAGFALTPRYLSELAIFSWTV